MRRFVLAAFALTVLAACQPATTELTEEQKAEIVSAINQVNARGTEALNIGDVDGWLATVSDDVQWGSAYGFASRDLIATSLRAEADSSTDAEWPQAWDETEVRVLGPDAAVFWGTYAFGGGDHIQRSQITLVYARIDGEWKIVHGHMTVAESLPESG